jgi:hypothetical protein
MDSLKTVQELVPWLTGLPLIPKVIISVLIFGAAAFILVLVWTPPKETAVATIVSQCYRRALTTRMHAEIDMIAMFKSIDYCRRTVEKEIPNIRSQPLQRTAQELFAALDQIDRYRSKILAGGWPYLREDQSDFNAVNVLKLAAVSSLRKLAASTGNSYPLPAPGTLGSAFFFNENDANAPPSEGDLLNTLAINPKTGAIK